MPLRPRFVRVAKNTLSGGPSRSSSRVPRLIGQDCRRLPHFLVGAGMVWGAIWWPSFRRRRSWYTLTDRRAFIATDLPIQGRRLQSWPINRGTRLELREGPPDSVFFATRKKRGRNGTYTVPVGFERIPDGKQVLRLMRDIQKGAA